MWNGGGACDATHGFLARMMRSLLSVVHCSEQQVSLFVRVSAIPAR
jgi:hypothetical protein